MQKPKARWFLLEELCNEHENIKAADVNVDAMGARLYFADGTPALIVFQFPLEAAHEFQLKDVRMALQAQFETPVLIMGPSFRAMKLREATEIESRRLENEYRRQT